MNSVAVSVGVSDELGDVGNFHFASHVVKGALLDAAVCWIFCFWGGAVVDVEGRSREGWELCEVCCLSWQQEVCVNECHDCS